MAQTEGTGDPTLWDQIEKVWKILRDANAPLGTIGTVIGIIGAIGGVFIWLYDEMDAPSIQSQSTRELFELYDDIDRRQKEVSDPDSSEASRFKAYKAEIKRRIDDSLEARIKDAGIQISEVDKKKQEKAVEELIENANEDASQNALALIADGKVDEGLEELESIAQAASQDAAQKWRRVGRLAYGIDQALALKAYEQTIAQDPNGDHRDYLALSRIYRYYFGDLAKALDLLQIGKGVLKMTFDKTTDDPMGQREWAVVYTDIGDVLVGQGVLSEALKSYQSSVQIAERLVLHDPEQLEWQHDLSISYERIGDVQVRLGVLLDAMSSYQAAMTIDLNLADREPKNIIWQRGLSISYEKIGDVQVRMGVLLEALNSYMSSLSIRKKLVLGDQEKIEWQRDLAISYYKIGNVQVRKGVLAQALKYYKDGMKIVELLAKNEPKNSMWQRDKSLFYEGIGDVQLAQGALPEALSSYQSSLSIQERLAAHDPTNTEWQRDLLVSYYNLAGIAGSGVSWQKAYDQVRLMDQRGILFPGDRWMLEATAEKLAAEQAARGGED